MNRARPLTAGRPGNDARLAKDEIRAMHAAHSEMVADALHLGCDLTDVNRKMLDLLGTCAKDIHQK